MTSHPFASIGTAKSRLRNGIVSAQRIITVAPASPSANMHVTMAAYDGACEHLRSDIMRARKLFPDTNALLTGPQHGVADDALGARSHQRGPYYRNDEGRNRKTAEDILTAPKPEFPSSGAAHMPDVLKRQREARRKIIRQWMRLSRDKRQSIDEISTFAKIAAQQNEDAFVHSRRNPYEKIMGWLLPRAHDSP
jgi:hypothetical protein